MGLAGRQYQKTPLAIQRVHLTTVGMNAQEEEALLAEIYKKLGTFGKNRPSLSALLFLIFDQSNLGGLTAQLLPDGQLLIEATQRLGLMRLAANPLRLVAERGDVFGSPQPQDEGLPLLMGIFSPHAPLTLGKNNSLKMTEETRLQIQEAIHLLRLFTNLSYHVSSIEYQAFRGFRVHLPALGLYLNMGRAPFSQQMKKLAVLFATTPPGDKRMVEASLDYSGKILVKDGNDVRPSHD